MKKLAKNLVPGDKLRGGAKIIGKAIDRRVPLYRDAIAPHEVGFPVLYADGGQAIRILEATIEVEVE